VTGAALALLVPYLKPGSQTNPVFQAAQVMLLILAALSFYEVAANYNGPRLSVRNLNIGLTPFGGVNSSTQQFIEALNDSQKAFEASSRELASDNPKPADIKAGMTKAIDKLRKIPSLSAESDALAAELLAVMQDQYDLLQDVERSGRTTLAHELRMKKNSERYEKVIKSIGEWVDTNGENYGISMSKPR
jgi:hypothetical protein